MTCSLMYLFYDTLTEVLETLQQRCASLKLCQRVVLSFYYCIFGVPLPSSTAVAALLFMLFSGSLMYTGNQILFDEPWMPVWIPLSPVLKILRMFQFV